MRRRNPQELEDLRNAMSDDLKQAQQVARKLYREAPEQSAEYIAAAKQFNAMLIQELGEKGQRLSMVEH